MSGSIGSAVSADLRPIAQIFSGLVLQAFAR